MTRLTIQLVITGRLESNVEKAKIVQIMLALHLLLLCYQLLLDIEEQHNAPIHACMGLSNWYALRIIYIVFVVLKHVRVSRNVHPHSYQQLLLQSSCGTGTIFLQHRLEKAKLALC